MTPNAREVLWSSTGHSRPPGSTLNWVIFNAPHRGSKHNVKPLHLALWISGFNDKICMWVLAIPFLWWCCTSLLILADLQGCQTVRGQELTQTQTMCPEQPSSVMVLPPQSSFLLGTAHGVLWHGQGWPQLCSRPLRIKAIPGAHLEAEFLSIAEECPVSESPVSHEAG